MPELMSHVLLAYSLCVVLSWNYRWLDAPYITVGMVGAVIPDLAKTDILLRGEYIEDILGLPFDWFALHTAGGVFLSILIGTVLATRPERKRVFGLLLIGSLSHMLADAMLLTPTGLAYPMFWPVSGYQPTSPGLYLSTDPWPFLVTLTLAVVVTLVSRPARSYLGESEGTTQE